MYKWQKQIQIIVDEIDQCIIDGHDEELTLEALSHRLGYSQFYLTRKFKEITKIQFKEYLRNRRLAFALKEVRDSKTSFLDIALKYGFSSHEAFTRSFKNIYGLTPSQYRKNPKPVVLRTKINAFDRYFLGLEEIGMVKSAKDIKIYFVTIPAHKFLHIKNNQSNGYWDFWQKQNKIPGQDYETICGLLDSIKGKLDDQGGNEINCRSGQIMAYINDGNGRLCDWGIRRSECWGVRLPSNYCGLVPEPMTLVDIFESEYIVFEHEAFDYEQENRSVEEKIEKAMANFDYQATGYCLDDSDGRIMYFYFDPKHYFKYIRPVKKI